MEPGSQRIAHPERPCLADQHEKRRLEGILSIVLVAEDRQADAPDEGTVTFDERRERQLGHLIRFGSESLEELTVG